MSLPAGANFQTALTNNVTVWDVSHILPRGPGRQYQKRDADKIRFIVVHKSGANGKAGYEGLKNSVRYVTRSKHNGGRGWPGAPYTYWIPREPDLDNLGRLVIYRCQPDNVRSYHTGGLMNTYGVAIGCQGNYDGNWDLVGGIPNVEREPTDDQYTCVRALIAHLADRHGINLGLDSVVPDDDNYGLTGHWEHGKPVCPGDALRSLVLDLRGSPLTPVQPPGLPAAIPATGEVNPRLFTYKERQRSLKMLGYDPGPIDGLWGDRSRGALEVFQKRERIEADGWWGPTTADTMLRALRDKQLNVQSNFDDWEE